MGVSSARAGTISGRVLGPDGNPVANAPVSCFAFRSPVQALADATAGATPKSLNQVRTDADGRFEAAIDPAGPPVRFRIDPPGLPAVALEGPFDTAESVRLPDLALPDSSPLSGVVAGPDGKPVAGARVRVDEGFGAERDGVGFFAEAVVRIRRSVPDRQRTRSHPDRPRARGGLRPGDAGRAHVARLDALPPGAGRLRRGDRRRRVRPAGRRSARARAGRRGPDRRVRPVPPRRRRRRRRARGGHGARKSRRAPRRPARRGGRRGHGRPEARTRRRDRGHRGRCADPPPHRRHAHAPRGIAGQRHPAGRASRRRPERRAGRFSAGACFPATTRRSAEARAISPASVPRIPPPPVAAPSPAALALVPAASIAGRVVDAQGKPVRGATCRARAARRTRTLRRTRRFRDPRWPVRREDRARRSLPPRRSRRRSRAACRSPPRTRASRRPSSPGVTLKAGQNLSGILLTLTAGLAVKGRVIDVSAQPVAGAEIRAAVPSEGRGEPRALLPRARRRVDAGSGLRSRWRLHVAGLSAGRVRRHRLALRLLAEDVFRAAGSGEAGVGLAADRACPAASRSRAPSATARARPSPARRSRSPAEGAAPSADADRRRGRLPVGTSRAGRPLMLSAIGSPALRLLLAQRHAPAEASRSCSESPARSAERSWTPQPASRSTRFRSARRRRRAGAAVRRRFRRRRRLSAAPHRRSPIYADDGSLRAQRGAGILDGPRDGRRLPSRRRRRASISTPARRKKAWRSR